MATTQNQMETKTLSEEQLKNSVMSLLFVLAEGRQATVSKETYKLYSAKLWMLPLTDLGEVVESYLKKPRREGETAFPPLPDLVAAMSAKKAQRLQHAAEKQRRAEVEEWFWTHIDFLKSSKGWSEQQALDSITSDTNPTFAGRRARPADVQRAAERREYEVYLRQDPKYKDLFPWKAPIPKSRQAA